MNLRPFVLIFLFTAFAGWTNVYGQVSRKVNGAVRDTAGKAISGASVRFIVGADTTRTATAEDGTFHLTVQSGTFSLYISYLGYSAFRGSYLFKEEEETMELAPITLRSAPQLLKEVAIEAPVQAVTMKRDTMEYDTRAFNVRDGDRVEDLLRQLPGVEVDLDGNVMSEGRAVQFLRVNGKDFFTGNVTEFIKQLPANILAKLQIIDDYGDEAAFTGVRTGQPRKMLNLVTKPGMDHGTFGVTNITAGTNKRYNAGASGNYWNASKQVAANGTLSTANNVRGVNTGNNAGLSYSDQFGKKLTASANYSYGSTRGSFGSESYTETVNTLGTLFNRNANESGNRNYNHFVNAGINYNAGKSGYLNISPSFNLANGSSSAISTSYQSGVILQDLESKNTSRQGNSGFGSRIGLARRIGTKGRNLSLSASLTNSRNTNNDDVSDRIGYYTAQGAPAPDSLLHRLVTGLNRSLSGSVNVSFSEALTKKAYIDFSYGLNASKNMSNLATDVVNPAGNSRHIDSLSNSGNITTMSHRMALSYRYTIPKVSASAGVTANPTSVRGHYAGRDEDVKNKSMNFSPQANVSYLISKSSSFSLSYSGTSNAPNFSQLQPVRDTRNLQNVLIGNPDLKASFAHRAGVNYRLTNPKKGTTLMLGFTGGMTTNQIVTNTLLRKDTLGSLKQETRYENVNGSYNFGSNYSYSIPYKVGGKRSQVTLNGNLGYNRMISLADNVANYSNGLTFGQTLGSTLNLKNVNVGLNGSYTTNYNQYTLGIRPETSISTWRFSANAGLRLKKLSLNTNLSQGITTGYKGIQPRNRLMVNGSLSQRLFKSDAASLNIQVNDLLNTGAGPTRTISGNAIVENRTNYITRFATLSFSMQLRKFAQNID